MWPWSTILMLRRELDDLRRVLSEKEKVVSDLIETAEISVDTIKLLRRNDVRGDGGRFISVKDSE